MKVKGINPIEQNVEKIVLGVAGAALLGVVAMQVLGGSTVEVKAGQAPVALDRAYEPVKVEAQAVMAQMTEGSPRLPEAPVVDLLGQYNTSAGKPVAVRPRLVALGPPMSLSTSASADNAQPITDAVYSAIRVPAPAAPSVNSFRSTLDPIQVSRSPEIAAIVPVAQPHDKAAITIETTFNGRALQEMLRTDPDGAGGPIRPIPLRWWQDGLEIVAIHAERQTQRADGSWSDAEAVAPMPGQIDLLKPTAPEERFNPVTIRGVIASARQMSRQVLRPDYFRVIAGSPWMPPSAAAKVATIESRRPEIDRLLNARREMERQIRVQEALLERGPATNTPRTQPGGGEPGRQPEPPRTNPTQPATQDPAMQAIRARIAEFRDQLVRSEETLKAIGVGIDGKPLPVWEAEEEGLSNALPPLENDAVDLWVHDVRVESGAVYRYRMQVVLNNPFFGNGPALLADQQSLAAEPFLYGEWSDWSAPAAVEQDRYYFVTAASTRDALGAMPRAQVEVFEFYYGFWRRGTASLAGGDIVVAEVELPAPEFRPLYDLTKPPSTGPTVVPGQPVNPGGPPPRPGEESEAEQRIRERQEREGRNPGNPGFPGGPPPGPVLPQVTALAVPGPAKLPVARTNAVLLDVTTLPGGQDTVIAGMREVVQAIFRTSSGRIEVRSPDTDRVADSYRRLRQSAEAGMRQNQPEPVREEEPEPVFVPPPINRNPSVPPGGGGGGGGGGG